MDERTQEEREGAVPTLAEQIIELRGEGDGLRSIADLQEVEGIGEERLAAFQEAVLS